MKMTNHEIRMTKETHGNPMRNNHHHRLPLHFHSSLRNSSLIRHPDFDIRISNVPQRKV